MTSASPIGNSPTLKLRRNDHIHKVDILDTEKRNKIETGMRTEISQATIAAEIT
jgi:hypothetical protein